MSRGWRILGIGLLASLATGCGGDRTGSAADPSTYTVLVPGDWTTRLARDNVGKFLLFLELAAPDENGVLEGRLAKSWEHSADYREWTIHLRTGVRWHDGVPVTAHDVKFTVDLWNRPDVLHPSRIESVDVVDDSTFVMTYKRGSAWHTFWYPGYWPVFYPKHLLEDLDPAEFDEWEFWKRPVGNGPFRYVRHLPQTMVEFEANRDFYLGRPQIDRLVIKFGPESITELLAGNVDAMNLKNRSAVEGIKDDPRFAIYYEAWDDISAVLALLYNHRNPLFAGEEVRRAIAHAIDRDELKRLMHKWPDLPIVDVPFTEDQYWNKELPEPLPFEPARARRLLEDAGWRDRNGDGVRDLDGEEFSFSVIVERRYQPVAVYVRQKLGEVGIRVDITTLDFGVLMERMAAREFEVAMGYLWVSPDDPDAGLEIVYGENSMIGYRNPRVIELVDAALETISPDTLDAIYRQLAPILQREQPVTFLSFGTEIYIANSRIKGFSSPFRSNPIWSAGYLWIEPE